MLPVVCHSSNRYRFLLIMQASQNYKRNENQSNVRSVIRFIPVVPLPNWHRLSRIWNDKLQIGVDVEARQTPTAERGNVGGRGYCLTVLHYVICLGVCVCVCVQCGASVVLIFRFGMRVTLCFLLHVRPDMLYLLLLLLLLLLTYPGPHSCPPLSSSLCRVFCNGFHAGRLARPA